MNGLLSHKEERLGIGMLSGTSLDGIDVGLFRFTGPHNHCALSLLMFETLPFRDEIKTALLRNLTPETARLPEISSLHSALGHEFADAVLQVLQRTAYRPEEIDFIGSHGQTLWHDPLGTHFQVKSTFQLGDGSIIAGKTGILTISDFRMGELAFGEDGAPLAPYFDRAMYQAEHTRILVNLGGIANVSLIPPRTSSQAVLSFDTGPGNLLIDKAMRLYYGKAFDEHGIVASKGTVDEATVDRLLGHSYFLLPVPKSTGRELFSDAFFQGLVNDMTTRGISAEDQVTTLTHITIESLVRTIRQTLHDYPLFGAPEWIAVGGGGALNAYLMRRLSDIFSPIPVFTQDKVTSARLTGVSAKAKESGLFALLADALVSGESASLRTPALLGKVCFPPDYFSSRG